MRAVADGWFLHLEPEPKHLPLESASDFLRAARFLMFGVLAIQRAADESQLLLQFSSHQAVLIWEPGDGSLSLAVPDIPVQVSGTIQIYVGNFWLEFPGEEVLDREIALRVCADYLGTGQLP